VYTCSH